MEEEEHDFPEILEVNDEIKLAIPPKRTGTWKNGFSNMKDALTFSKQHEPHEDLGSTEFFFEDWEGEKYDIECSLSKITKEYELEEDSLIIFHVGSIGRRYGEPTHFYVTVQINNFLLHNCVFDLDASRNIVTQRFMNQLGLNISRPYNDT